VGDSVCDFFYRIPADRFFSCRRTPGFFRTSDFFSPDMACAAQQETDSSRASVFGGSPQGSQVLGNPVGDLS